MVSISFSIISKDKGICLLYLADRKEKFKLRLSKSKKENEGLIIREKEGDILDIWVLRHSSPLLIEDTRKDFRFDSERLKSQHGRSILSLISAPLVSEDSFFGILRLDRTEAYSYSQDDLRLLVTIADFGVVALENGELFERTQELAIRDGLTSFYRKEYFLERLREECKRALRQNEVFSLLMVDIDYFKNYNDKFGHTAGDIVLKALSRKMRVVLGEYNPIIGRFGGEEFSIILPFTDAKHADIAAANLRESIENMKVNLRRHQTQVTVSVGVAVFPLNAEDENELIYKADHAMYKAKRSGRNRVANA